MFYCSASLQFCDSEQKYLQLILTRYIMITDSSLLFEMIMPSYLKVKWIFEPQDRIFQVTFWRNVNKKSKINKFVTHCITAAFSK